MVSIAKNQQIAAIAVPGGLGISLTLLGYLALKVGIFAGIACASAALMGTGLVLIGLALGVTVIVIVQSKQNAAACKQAAEHEAHINKLLGALGDPTDSRFAVHMHKTMCELTCPRHDWLNTNLEAKTQEKIVDLLCQALVKTVAGKRTIDLMGKLPAHHNKNAEALYKQAVLRLRWADCEPDWPSNQRAYQYLNLKESDV